jgi:hypothetical protein
MVPGDDQPLGQPHEEEQGDAHDRQHQHGPEQVGRGELVVEGQLR